ncbi:hypothetical protein GS454_24670 [Rhodococcus hoagii]|nr:hypothetical protein [Prescottella equi]
MLELCEQRSDDVVVADRAVSPVHQVAQGRLADAETVGDRPLRVPRRDERAEPSDGAGRIDDAAGRQEFERCGGNRDGEQPLGSGAENPSRRFGTSSPSDAEVSDRVPADA